MDRIEIKEGSSSSSDEGESSGSETVERKKNAASARDIENAAKENAVVFPNEKRKKTKLKSANKKEQRKKAMAKRDRDRLGMTVPNIVTDRDTDRALARIATKGVVQLFNAVTQRQKELDEKLFAGGHKLDKAAKKSTLQRLGRSEFEKRLAVMNKVKEEDTPVSKFEDDEEEMETDTSFVKTEPESEED